MVATVDVLLTGYVESRDDGEHVQGTVSLVRSGDAVIVVDPGMTAGSDDIEGELRSRGLSTGEVTHVFLTHHHVDHCKSVGLFPNALVVDGQSVYRGDIWDDHEGDGYEIAGDVSVIETPGHSAECASLVVGTVQGTVVLTHAWWFSDMTPTVDPLAVDQAQLEESRRRILGLATLIVPGHGAAFAPAT